jgi:hypothetical protein
MIPRPTARQQKSIELMQQNAVSTANALPDNQTTEERLKDIRASMRFFIPKQTFGREHGRIQGYYYTEQIDVGRV